MGIDSEEDYDDYDHLSQASYSDSDSHSHALIEADDHTPDTPRSSPPEVGVGFGSRLIPSRTKRLHCTWEGCDKAFVRQSRLDEHLRTHTNTRIFACPHQGCTKSYFRDSHLKVHIKSVHSTEKDYKCDRAGCNKSFATGQRLRNHLKTHECRDKYRCSGYEGCNQAFRKKEMLRRHVVSVHEKKKPFACAELDALTGEKCTREFDTAQKLRNHQKTNHDETRYSCSECLAYNAGALEKISADNKGPQAGQTRLLRKAYFATLLQLQAHNAEVHPPTCPHCQAICSTQRQLKAHLELAHDILSEACKGGEAGKPRVTCPYQGCGKTYSKTGNLNMHIRTIHEGSVKFICGQDHVALMPDQSSAAMAVQGCGKAYSGKQALVDHIRTEHLGLESYRQSRRKRKAGINVGQGLKRARMDGSDVNLDHSQDGTSTKATDDVPAFVWPAIGYDEPIEEEEEEEDDDDDDANGLSESMSILGSHIFHRGESFHYPSGEYPSALNSLDLGTNPYQPAYQAEDPFFGQMEGLSDHHVLDPQLFFNHAS